MTGAVYAPPGKGKLYLTRADLEVLAEAYPDEPLRTTPTWRFFAPRVAKAYACCLQNWAAAHDDDPMSTVALMLAGDLWALEAGR